MSSTLPLEHPTKAKTDAPMRGAQWSVMLLLAINLFNYIDRQVLSAVESEMEKTLLPGDPRAQEKIGYAASAFLLSYTIIAPLFGWLADRMSRWVLVGIGVMLWSLASGGTGLATGFIVLIASRCFVGIGEAAYGPAAPTILSDLYPVKSRGRILSWFYLAIPVGSAAGYILGGQILSHFHNWRIAFYVVTPPGLLLGAMAFFFKDPRANKPAEKRKPLAASDYLGLLHNRSYLLDTLGMAAMTFAIGGIAFWMPKYVAMRLIAQHYYTDDYQTVLGKVNWTFGGISAVAGAVATLAGGITGDALRKRFSGSYFLVSGIAMLVGFPLLLGMLWAPFPLAWGLLAAAVFCLFFNTGPTNTALANSVNSAIRPAAFAINIFIIHMLGDVVSPPLIGGIAERVSRSNRIAGFNVAFTVVSFFILIGGVLWLWAAKYLAADTEAASQPLPPATDSP